MTFFKKFMQDKIKSEEEDEREWYGEPDDCDDCPDSMECRMVEQLERIADALERIGAGVWTR